MFVVDVSLFESRVGRAKLAKEQVLFERVLAAAVAADRQGFFVELQTVLDQDGGLVVGDVELVWGSSKFQQSLEDRGIKRTLDPRLSLRQEMFLQAYLSPVNLLAPQVLARRMKIGLPELDGWLREKSFASAMSVKSRENLEKFLPLADQALGQLVQQGDMKAITFLNQLTGRFDASARQSVDVPSLLLQVQDIVLRNVRDPVTKRNIGRELIALAQGNSPLTVIQEPVSDVILVDETIIDVTPIGEVL